MNAASPLPPPPAELLDRVRQDPGDALGWLALGGWMDQHHGPAAAAQQVEYGVRHARDPEPLLEFIARTLQATPSAPLRISALNRLARLRPEDPDILAALGMALIPTAAAASALKPLREAVRLGVKRIDVLQSLGFLEHIHGEPEAARQHYRAVVEQDPQQSSGWLGLYRLSLEQWRWDEAEDAGARARACLTTSQQLSQSSNHMLLALYGNDTPALLPGQVRQAPPMRQSRPVGRRLRLGYLSADFRDHAVAHLMAGHFEQHNRDRFEVFLYSYGPRTRDAYQERIKASVEHWTELNDLDDSAAVAQMLRDQLDILIELTGHTYGARNGISARRVAPIQIHYLGYAGSIGGWGIDYYLADAITVPPEGEAEFAETVLRLPRCFMVTDDKRALTRPLPRAAAGLPEDAIVLINYNQSWKITLPYLELWLDALARHPQAVLWLRTPGAEARQRLLALAEQRGVPEASRRIMDFTFCPDNQAHLDRIALADLAVDQLPYSSHSVGAELLWAGVPLLTQRGVRFAGRVGASLVHAVREPAFIVENLEQYAQRLDELLRHPEELLACQRRLREGRRALPLFDTAGFTRDFEALLFSLYD